MRTTIGTFDISGLRTAVMAVVIGLGVAAIGPATALARDVNLARTSVTESGVADNADATNNAAGVGSIDHVLETSLSDKL
jgi:hypothetical protein